MTNAVAQITNSVSPINGLDVVNAVNGFYSSAFSHTVWLLGILIGLIGIVVPAAYYFLQSRQLALKEKILSEHLENEVSKLGATLRKTNLEFLEEKQKATQVEFEKLEANITSELHFAKGGICLVQANAFLSAGDHKTALQSFTWAIDQFSKVPSAVQIQTCLRAVIEGVLPLLKKNDFIDSESTDHLNKIIELTKEIKAKGLLNEKIDELNKAWAEAKKR